MSLTDLQKNKASPIAYQKRLKEANDNKYKGWKQIYTNGSKSKIGVEAAVTTGNHTESASLPSFISIFTAETLAIHQALNTISATKAAYKSFKNKIRPTQ